MVLGGNLIIFALCTLKTFLFLQNYCIRTFKWNLSAVYLGGSDSHSGKGIRKLGAYPNYLKDNRLKSQTCP